MHQPKTELEQFKRLQISKATLKSVMESEPPPDPCVVHCADVIAVLQKYQAKKITLETLLEWVNTIWFTDFFELDEDEHEVIAVVMNALEELDEPGVSCTDADLMRMIRILRKEEPPVFERSCAFKNESDYAALSALVDAWNPMEDDMSASVCFAIARSLPQTNDIASIADVIFRTCHAMLGKDFRKTHMDCYVFAEKLLKKIVPTVSTIKH